MHKNSNIEKVSLKESLRFTLLIWFLLLSLIPAIIISYKSYESSVKNLKEAAIYELKQSSSLNKNFINNWFSYRKTDISSWSQSESNTEFLKKLSKAYGSSKKSAKEFIKSFAYVNLIGENESDILTLSRQYDYIYDIFMIDTKGNILYSIAKEKDLGTNLVTGTYSATSFASAYRKTLEDGDIHFSDLEYYAPSNNEVASFLTAPLVDRDGEVIGVFAVELKLDRIFSLFGESADKMLGFSHYLVGVDGLLRSDILLKEKVLNFRINTAQFLLWYEEHGPAGLKLAEQKEEVLHYKDPFGDDVIGLHQDINILGVKWVLISEVSQKSVLTATNEVAKINIIFLSITILIVIIAALFITRRITRPLQRLANASIDFSKGKRDVVVDVNSKGELGQLASAFSIMIESLKVNEIKLTNQTVQAHKLLEELDEQRFALDAHSIVAITNVKGDITFVNDKFIEISGYSKEELIGRNHRLLNSGVHGREFWLDMYKTVSGGKIWHDEVCNIAKDRNFYWVDTTIVPFMDENNKPKSYIAIRTDITDKKAAEKELLEAKEIAEDSVKAKAEFLASMSHEIRTPMNGVIGMLGLLLNTKLDDAQKHQASLAQGSAKALLTLINDILDFSKVEAGKMDLEEIDFNLRDEFGDFAESIAFIAQEKGVELILDVTNVDRKIINADPGRIRQILSNIVGNSIKFTHEGYILIKASLNIVDDEKARLIIEMSDTGIGIPEDKISTLFDSFSQVDSTTTRKYGGTGLGLAIVKKLSELMDGKVAVKSNFGHGSIFTVDLAVKLSKKSSLVMPKVSIEGKKVLIVDRCELAIDALQNQLEHWGMNVYSEIDAKDALQRIENDSFDITFINMDLPDMDGETLGEKIRNNSKYADMKLIMMTSLEDRGNISRYVDIGFDAFFPKPITTKDLFIALNTLVKDTQMQTIKKAQSDEEELLFDENTNILLVEDNLTNQLVANGILENFGVEADVANHGLEALEILNTSSKKYDIILMDCQMPHLDGYDTTRAIRDAKAGEIYTKIPIIAMTANAMQGDREKCSAAGMDDYLTKPIDTKILKNILQKWLFKDKQRDT